MIPQKDVEILECDELGLPILLVGEDPQLVFSDEAMQKLNFAFYRNYAQQSDFLFMFYGMARR